MLLYLYAAILFFINLSRCFDNVIWGDEGFSILLVEKSIPEILSGTAADVHPPLYYLWLKLFEVLFDGAGWHIPTLITYGVILIIGVTWVRKHFGFGCSALFITLCSFLKNAVQYNVEIRMYSMAEMFVLLSFIFLYNILQDHKWKDYFLFALFSLGAAYSHYYALFTVAFLYLFLLIYDFCRKLEIRKILTTCAVTVLGYSPWLTIFIKALAKKVTTGYWITTIPTWRECLDYLFSGKLEEVLLCVYILLIIIVIAAEILGIKEGCLKVGTVQPSSNDMESCNNHIFRDFIRDKYCRIEASLELRKSRLSSFSWWIIAGQIGIVGTIALGLGFSHAVRPVFDVRYILPAAVISWIVMAACISKIRWKNVIALILTAVIIINYGSSFKNTLDKENSYKEQIETILECTGGINEESLLVTNVNHLNWTLLEYYYPGINQAGTLDLEISEIETWDYEETDLWIFWDASLDEETIEIVEDAGYTVVFVFEGNMGEYNYVDIYHLFRE